MKENNELVGELCLSFYSVYKLFSQHYTKLLSEFDLTYTQYLVLMVLWKNPRQTLSEVGKRLDLSSNTLTP
ncbi:MarR family transcriptional regulator, partial [Streptococcus hyovaginalis]|uniref:MarR family winged helix-turn-helix transcriptional regulator n=1 Tax=Streptococcus hyovaginalis TaxID=149015 RepID=UPI002A804D12